MIPMSLTANLFFPCLPQSASIYCQPPCQPHTYITPPDLFFSLHIHCLPTSMSTSTSMSASWLYNCPCPFDFFSSSFTLSPPPCQLLPPKVSSASFLHHYSPNPHSFIHGHPPSTCMSTSISGQPPIQPYISLTVPLFFCPPPGSHTLHHVNPHSQVSG